MTGSTQVLDTGVLVGIAVAHDQHHGKCLEFVLETDEVSYATPTVGNEFRSKLPEVRDRLSRDIKRHRSSLAKQISKKRLNRTDLVQIREQILDTALDAHRFLFEFYDQLAQQGEIKREDLMDRLSDMATEVHEDAAKEHGGFNTLVSAWSGGVDNYSKIEEELLICEGDDPDVCLEAHHIAVTLGGETELGTTNPNDFIKQQKGEPEERKENILRLTALSDVRDLSIGRYP
ncbi:hypothetical protein [Halomicrobium katesii]|uniref:hypothetical protein n=1 Tax=Halomicrobium katesii TaxID=437163 RepID=UPI0012BAE7CF|nr:hypothetical protein [Halomicrobium katesii]